MQLPPLPPCLPPPPTHCQAIMGPSGCGKTTLLDTLAGRLASNAQYTGDIRVNGRRTKLTGRSAYAMQDDVLIGGWGWWGGVGGVVRAGEHAAAGNPVSKPPGCPDSRASPIPLKHQAR